MKKSWKQINKEASALIKERAKEKLSKTRQKPLILFKLAAEAIVSVGIAAGLFVYLDPSINLIAFPWNIILFIIAILLLLYLRFFYKG